MKNLFKLLGLIVTMIGSSISYAQNYSFNQTSEKFIRGEKITRVNTPEVSKIFTVNFQNINDYLLNAPSEFDVNAAPFYVNFPNAEGEIISYRIFKSPVFEAELQEKYDGIYSYKGFDEKNPTNNFRLAVSYIHGMHLMGRSATGETYYMDTYTHDLNSYILYKRKNIHNSNPTGFECDVIDTANTENIDTGAKIQSEDGVFRQYRLAMACTTEYANYHIYNAPSGTPTSTLAQKKAVVLSAMNVTVNRVNTVYENDLAIRLVLVGNNDNVIFINDDNFNNNDAGMLIYQSQTVIDANIGNSNYDIGHTVSTGGGGLAGLGVVCNNYSKARGITGSNYPVGDPFDIDYVAHEMGHQFGAEHTFNGYVGACQGNANPSTSAEPGSGSTIMAYAGICSGQNVQNNSDAYFHYYSIKNINDRLASGTTSSCATILSTSNATPIINGGLTKRIPKGTPFKLTASATDSNNPTSLTYCWEQIDTQQVTYPLQSDYTSGPAFRSYTPTANPTRYFPKLETILEGVNTASGTPSSTWEKLPTVARSLTFGITVRDNDPINGGQTNRATQAVIVTNAGPFYLTNPSNVTGFTMPEWNAGETRNITWNVGGTTAAPINTSHVNILYTADEGQTFVPIVENIPNDGAQEIIIPTLPDNTEIRIMVEPVDNVYFAISKKIRINTPAAIEDFAFENFELFPNPTDGQFTFVFTPENTNGASYEIFDINGRLLASKTLAISNTIKETVSIENYASGVYLLKIKNGNKVSTHKSIKK